MRLTDQSQQSTAQGTEDHLGPGARISENPGPSVAAEIRIWGGDNKGNRSRKWKESEEGGADHGEVGTHIGRRGRLPRGAARSGPWGGGKAEGEEERAAALSAAVRELSSRGGGSGESGQRSTSTTKSFRTPGEIAPFFCLTPPTSLSFENKKR